MRILLTFIFAIISMTLSAQQSKGSSSLPVQEKVYLHIDNNTYFLGDTIWYKAYVVLADDNSPEPLSRILYVELLNQQGYLMERQQLVVDRKGQADGCFAINDSLFAGYYEIRAYTKWMLNFGYEPTKSWNRFSWLYFEKDQGYMAWDSEQGGAWGETADDWIAGSTTNAQMSRMIDSIPIIVTHRNDRLIIDEATRQPYYMIVKTSEYNNGANITPDSLRTTYRQYSNLFSRVLPVYSRPDSMENYRRRIMPVKITMGDYSVRWKTPEFDVRFYPEGGSLLAGHRCRVAWEAMNQELERLNVSGLLLEDGEPIDSIRPTHAGRGVFYLNVRHGRKYTARFTFGKDEFTFNLPAAEEEGVALRVTQDDDKILLRTAQQFATQRRLTLGIYCRGLKVTEFELGKQGTDEFEIDKRDIPEGVSQAVVHDRQGTVFADRLFFVNKCYESRATVEVLGIPNRPYRPLEHIRLNMLATDAKGRPLRDETFSVSIRDADQLDPSFATGNVMTHLLLESEIRGFVETPDYYFEADDSLHRQALDLLLMVQGWRRYDWRAAERPETARIDYLPEQKTIVYGDVFPLRKQLFGSKDRKIEVSCTLVNLNDDLKEGDYYIYKGLVDADSTGHFSFAYDPFYGTVRLNMKARYAGHGDEAGGIFHHDPKIFLRKEYFYPQALKAYSWYETHEPDTIKQPNLSWDEYMDDIYASEWIPMVSIKAKRRAHAKRQLNRPVYSVPFIDFINDVWDQGFYNQFYLMNGGELPLKDTTGLSYQLMLDSYVRMQYEPDANNHESHKFHIDWNAAWYFERLQNVSFLPTIKCLDIVSDAPRRPVPYEHYHEDRWGGESGYVSGIDSYINLTTTPYEERTTYDGRQYNFQGFTRPVEFYNPDYSKAKLTEVKDYRRTLYWNPSVKTDRNGQISIDFYNNSVCTTIDVSAEGITKYGQFIINK